MKIFKEYQLKRLLTLTHNRLKKQEKTKKNKKGVENKVFFFTTRRHCFTLLQLSRDCKFSEFNMFILSLKVMKFKIQKQ